MLMYNHFNRAEVIMLTIPCIIAFYSEFPVILLHYAPDFMHYSQTPKIIVKAIQVFSTCI